ncbi:permease [Caldanaerobius polysaccharolyticus]|uniref:permease n=1 Tax=Caldanaerobius polysaccharolyticus TaxID=44256 RepID=UPI00047BEE77|nr:permease [Caldanaerobius polysaccharolyticus]
MIQSLADYIVYNLMNIAPQTRAGNALNFFIYDTIKIFVLLAVLIYTISFIRSFLPPEKVKKILSRKHEYIGNTLAALLGIFTPFCSCSAVPLFIGFIEAGVPLGVTFSFLVASPVINEVAATMLFALFGFKIAVIYILSGLIIAIISGLIIGKLHLEHLVEDYVYNIHVGETAVTSMNLRARHDFAFNSMKDIVKRVWLFIILGVGFGAFIHGYAPVDFMGKIAGKDNLLAVPIATIIGIPLYSNAAGTIPIVQALTEKGVSIGTALSFMMSITALSVPEMIILRKVIKPKLIGIFIGIVGIAIMFTGYLFNIII